MTSKNVTLRLDAELLKRCKHIAIEEDKSLSQWLTDILEHAITQKDDYSSARQRALKLLQNPSKLGGKKFSREEAYEV